MHVRHVQQPQYIDTRLQGLRAVIISASVVSIYIVRINKYSCVDSKKTFFENLHKIKLPILFTILMIYYYHTFTIISLYASLYVLMNVRIHRVLEQLSV